MSPILFLFLLVLDICIAVPRAGSLRRGAGCSFQEPPCCIGTFACAHDCCKRGQEACWTPSPNFEPSCIDKQDLCSGRFCDHTIYDCIGGRCCDERFSCGSNCCEDPGPNLPGYINVHHCANKALSLCCQITEVDCGGVCCRPGIPPEPSTTSTVDFTSPFDTKTTTTTDLPSTLQFSPPLSLSPSDATTSITTDLPSTSQFSPPLSSSPSDATTSITTDLPSTSQLSPPLSSSPSDATTNITTTQS